jgi:two-component system sensor histidine kinase BaeS
MVDGVYPLDRAHLEPVLEETRLLARLIEDLSTLALAESGALELHPELADLGTLVGETVASFRPQAESAGVALEFDTAAAIPSVRLDPARIRQVIVNLVSNALRYTPRGGNIHVRSFLEDRYAVVTVADTGSGIPPENLDHVFDRYYKARDSKGSGLGLAIARNLVVLHGGEISAESKAGEGTVIRFRLPL